MTAGQILHANSTAPNQDLLVTVFDSTGAQICYDNQGDCPLTGAGPYFVQVMPLCRCDHLPSRAQQHQPAARLPTRPQLTYGSAPKTGSVNRCRTLTVPTAGQYQVYAVSPQPVGIPASTVYTPDGAVACTNTYSSTAAPCQLAAGTYNLVADPYPANRAQVGAIFIAADESQGCTATGDSDSPRAASGTFAGVGEEVCLTLPTASGLDDYMFDQHNADGSAPQMKVVDSTGAQQCPNADFDYTVCDLSGTAPFRVILSGQPAGGGIGS